MLGQYVPGSIPKFKDYFEAFSSLKRERPLINLLLLTKILEKPMMIFVADHTIVPDILFSPTTPTRALRDPTRSSC